MKHKTTNYILIALLLILGIYTITLLVGRAKFDTRIIERFAHEHTQLIQDSKNASNGNLDKTFEGIFVDCPNRNEYDLLLEKNSLTMTPDELRKGLELHEACSQYFTKKKDVILSEFQSHIESTLSTASLIQNKTRREIATRNASMWKLIFELEYEKNMLMKRMSEIQEDYWKTELAQKTGEISADARETVFVERNEEARDNIARMEQILNQLSGNKEIEETLWNELKTVLPDTN